MEPATQTACKIRVKLNRSHSEITPVHRRLRSQEICRVAFLSAVLLAVFLPIVNISN
jgi:hypothetical protein